MTARLRRRRLVSGTALVLCSVTIVLTVFGVDSYVRYQQLSADARTASVNLDKVERYFGQWDPFSQDSPWCDSLCFIVDGGYAASGEKSFEFVAFVDGTALDRIDFLDEAGQTVFSVSAESPTAIIDAAQAAADDAAHAAEDAMMNLVAVGGGALLAFLAMSVLGWMATRRRVASRRVPQRRGAADSGIRQQSSGGQAWMDRVTMGLIASALRALDHPDDQDRYREEWAADYDEIQGKKQRLRWALLLRLFAPVGIRSARRDALTMSPPPQQ